jgi:hypothetical protein
MSEPQSISLETDFSLALDICLFAEACGITPDPVQRRILQTNSRRIIVNAHRQNGKSTICALLCLHACIYQAPVSCVIVSPSQQQSGEMLRKVNTFWSRLKEKGAPDANQESLSRLTFSTGSRVLSLPGNSTSVRGYSADLIIIDECARCSNELISATSPMVAAAPNGGRLILLSTPAGRRGYFFEQFQNGTGWEKVSVKATECSRISPEFLEQERAQLGPLMFGQEYMCEFHDSETSVFSSQMIDAVLCGDEEFKPFLPTSAVLHA